MSHIPRFGASWALFPEHHQRQAEGHLITPGAEETCLDKLGEACCHCLAKVQQLFQSMAETIFPKKTTPIDLTHLGDSPHITLGRLSVLDRDGFESDYQQPLIQHNLT